MSAVNELTSLMFAPDPYAGVDDGMAELRLACANERFEEQRSSVRALDARARESGIDRIKSRDDLVPLLFAHSVYKSYPESFIAQNRWKNMSVWLDTVVNGSVSGVDVSGCRDIDDWIDRLDAAGFHAIVSSGTSGKNSFLMMDDVDLDVLLRLQVHLFAYPYVIEPRNDRPVTIMAPANVRMRLGYSYRAYGKCFARPGAIHSLTDEPVRVADTLRQVGMRRAMADGTAKPSEIAAYEAEVQARSKRVASDLHVMMERILSYRNEPQIINGPWTMAWRLMEEAHAAGIPDGSFHPETIVSIAGGLKGLTLPADYQDQMDRFLGPVRRPKLYAMSEQFVVAPGCEYGVYHWPKALELFILDESGEHIVPIDASGRATGRVAFYDPMWHGRWGGIVTGDKATASYQPCPCGRIGPTIEDPIVRYSELSVGGDDKLTCGGTIEEYIRGVTAEPV